MRDEPYRLRDQATRLLALALTSREPGQVEYSEHLTEAASEILLRGEQIERSILSACGSSGFARRVKAFAIAAPLASAYVVEERDGLGVCGLAPAKSAAYSVATT